MFEKPKKFSINLWGHPTSLTLEPAFWSALRVIAARKGSSVKKLVEQIDEERTQLVDPPNLSSSIRVWVLKNK